MNVNFNRLEIQFDELYNKRIELQIIKDSVNDSELKVLLNDILELISEHLEWIKEKLINKAIIKRNIEIEINNDRDKVKFSIETIELASNNIEDLLRKNHFSDEDRIILNELLNKYNYMDCEFENYMQRIDNNEI